MQPDYHPRLRVVLPDWVAHVLVGLECSFIIRRPAELRETLERRAWEISILARRTETETSIENGP